jgi:HAD superfamily hydrolase (TIGR01544 family)
MKIWEYSCTMPSLLMVIRIGNFFFPDNHRKAINLPKKINMDALLEWCQHEYNHVKAKDWQAVKEKLGKLHLEHTHIIADFDMTLTKYWDPTTGKRSMSSHGAFENWSGLKKEVKDRMDELYKKYYPIEVSSTIPYEEKYRAMVEWWTGAHDAILELKITKQDVVQMVKEAKFVFRPMLHEFIDLVTELKVPLLVFSAGLGDVIRETLNAYWTDDINIVSNRMIFDSNDVCVGFKDPLIHVFNKNEAGIANEQHALRIQSRSSVILMGDSLGDLKMADGIKHDVKLTIGFLNHDMDRLLPSYLDAFDIVLTNDTSLEFMIILLNCLK